MHIKPPITNLLIRVAKSGFYRGFSTDVTITAKLLVGALILWAIAFPENAASILGQLNSFIMAGFNYWYIYAMAFFVILCFVLALWPKVGKLLLVFNDVWGGYWDWHADLCNGRAYVSLR